MAPQGDSVSVLTQGFMVVAALVRIAPQEEAGVRRVEG